MTRIEGHGVCAPAAGAAGRGARPQPGFGARGAAGRRGAQPWQRLLLLLALLATQLCGVHLGVAAGAAVPIAHRSMWSASPASAARLPAPAAGAAGKWEGVSNTSVSFHLAYESVVLVSYHMLVVGDKPYHPGGAFLNDVQRPESAARDVVGARLAVDGQAYRASGSHLTPLASMEAARGQLDGHLVLQLPAGNHSVALQWRRWGDRVRAWSNVPTFRDGFMSGRSLLVQSEFDYMWAAPYVRPAALKPDTLSLSASGAWYDAPGMALKFTLSTATTRALLRRGGAVGRPRRAVQQGGQLQRVRRHDRGGARGGVRRHRQVLRLRA